MNETHERRTLNRVFGLNDAAALNELGAEGWRLIDMSSKTLFERPKNPPRMAITYRIKEGHDADAGWMIAHRQRRDVAKPYVILWQHVDQMI